MDLRLPVHHGEGYKSASQMARRITEPWGEGNLYCCSCISDRLTANAANAHVSDFWCPRCAETYQLKSHGKKLRGSILGSNYQKLIDAILGDKAPNFFLLNYQLPDWLVRNLLLIPRFAISPAVVFKRKPLSATARRKNWVGYVLNVALIPESARIQLIVDGVETSRREVREKYRLIAKIETLKPEQRGWTLDVLRCVESLPDSTFNNDDVYAFAPELAKLHPENRHVRDKIRQQLQVLRDRGFLMAVGRGIWQRI